MKEDKLFIVLFISLLAILMLGLMPRYSLENAITGAAVSMPSTTELWIGIVIIAVAVIVTATTLVLKKRKSRFESLLSENPIELERPAMPIEKPKTEEDRLSNYIQLSLSQGKSKSQIRRTLLSVGWPTETVDEVIRKL